MENRPNILWICSDQQRFDSLGCYGNPFVQQIEEAGTSYGSDGVDGGSSADASGSVVVSEDEHVLSTSVR